MIIILFFNKINKTKLLPESFSTDLFLRVSFLLLIIFDFYFMYVSWGPVPPRNYLTALISIIAFSEIKQLGFYPFIKKYQISLVLTFYPLLYWLFSLFFSDPTISINFITKDILKYGTLAFSLTYLLTKLKTQYIQSVLLWVVGINLGVAMLQLIAPKFGWAIREYIDPITFKEMIRIASRPSGLAYYTLTLSEQVLIAFPLFIHFIKNKLQGVSYWIILIFITFICISINNRGMIVGVLLSVFILHIKNPNKKELLLVCLIIILTVPFLVKYSRLFNFEFESDAARLDVLRVSLGIIKKNFLFGLGEKYYDLKKLIIQYGQDLVYLFHPEKLGSIGPHNYFINTHLKYGVIGTLVNIYILKKITYHKINFLIIVALGFNAMAHNGGFLNSSTILIGYYIALSLPRKAYCLSPRA